MKVLITVPCLELSGGVANYYRALRGYLDDDKVYFEVGRRPGEAGPTAAIFRLFADFWNFHRVLGRENWDLVHVNPSMVRRAVIRDGLLLLIACAHRNRVLVFFRGWDTAFAAQIRSRYIRLFRAVFRRAVAFIVLAIEFRDALADMGLPGPVFIETTVVDDSLLQSVPQEARANTGEIGACNILYLSRLDRGKGLLESIEAFALTKSIWPAVTLTIVGDGPERPAAEAGIVGRGLTGVRFVGHVDGQEKARLFRDADIFLFPTTYAEGMPNAVLEAMAFGLPVVTRAVGGIRDFFEDGQMGFVTDSRDPAVFSGFLARLVADPALRASMGRYNREYARRRFSASVVAARLVDIYAQLR